MTGAAMLGLPEWLQGGIAVICGTLFRPPERKRTNPIERHYHDSDEALTLAMRQLEIYERIADECSQIQLVRSWSKLDLVAEVGYFPIH